MDRERLYRAFHAPPPGLRAAPTVVRDIVAAEMRLAA